MNTLADRLRRRDNSLLTRAFLLALMTILATPSTFAQVAHGFRLLPDPRRSVSSQRAYFVYQSAAGTVIADTLSARNDSDQALRLKLFAADAVTASRGGVAVATRANDTPKQAGAWLRLSDTELTMEPGEHRSVPFTLSLPQDLAPGEYAASIVAQRAVEQVGRQSGPLGVRFIPRFAVTVLVTVPGSAATVLRPHLEITDLRAAAGTRRQTIVGDLGNTGNDGLDRAEGKLTVRQTQGALARDIPVRLGYFLAGSDLAYRIGLEPALPAGEYDVTLSLAHRQGTVELTRRLYLGETPEIPVLRADAPAAPSPTPAGLPRWVFMAIGAAGISIALLLLSLIVQSRKLARARLRSHPETAAAR